MYGSFSGYVDPRPRCGHDETALRVAAADASAAAEDLERARRALAGAHGVPWSGPAAAAFRRSTLALTLQLGLLAGGLAGLAVTLSNVQAETSACPGAAAGAPTLPLLHDTRTPLLPGRSTPLLPYASHTPILERIAPTPTVTGPSGAPPASWVCR